uniref:Uncharacterized protein n=1 Tax=Anopheles christyi TaxID=43041 RepID=A0A182KI20_9DIPT
MDTMMETMLFSTASISSGECALSLKHTSQTPMILCRSSSIPLVDFSSLISAPRPFRNCRSS